MSQDFPPQWTKGHWCYSKRKEKKNCWGVTFYSIHRENVWDTIKLIKRQLCKLHVEWSGITLACSDWWASIVRLTMSVWDGKRERERGWILCRKRKMLCWALSKESDSLFPFQSRTVQPGEPTRVLILGPASDQHNDSHAGQQRAWPEPAPSSERGVRGGSPQIWAKTLSGLFSRELYIQKMNSINSATFTSTWALSILPIQANVDMRAMSTTGEL